MPSTNDTKNAEHQRESRNRRARAYELAKALAKTEGIPIPRKNFPEDGSVFDAWLQGKITALVAIGD